MIAFVSGRFVTKSPSFVVVDVNGIGYELQISLNTYSFISNMENGKLHTHLIISENAHTLYGFFNLAEKELFVQLINVSGVGASTARMMLSGLKPDEIIKAIVENNSRQLETIKGIGRKTAERLVLELKDKLGKLQNFSKENPYSSTIETDAFNALIALGIPKNAAETALKKVMAANNNNSSVENIIKLALKNL